MSLAELFRSPFVRIPFLGFTIFSSVATSRVDAPGWSLRDGPAPEYLELAKGERVERRIAYDSSEDKLALDVVLDSFSTTTGKVRIVVPECRLDVSFVESLPGGWYALDADGNPSGDPAFPVPRGTGSCPGTRGLITLRIENIGDATLRFRAKVEAEVGNAATDEEPEGAFVKLETRP